MRKNNVFSFVLIDGFILIFIIILATSLRLYKIDTPLADLHSWRQADTASVARNYARDGINLLFPKYDDLSNIGSGKENPNGYRFVEFPFYNALVAIEYKLLPIIPIEVYGRLTTLFFSLLLIAALYYICLKENGRITAIGTAMVFAIFPFFIFFSRVVLADMTAISLTFISLFFLYVWSLTKRKYGGTLCFLLSLLFFALAILTKPTVIFYGLGLLFIFWRKYKLNFLKYLSFYSYFIISAIPFLLWRYHISFYPEGIPASDWLISQVNTYEGLKNIFFRPAFFRWIFFDRISDYIMGGYGIFLFVLGLVVRPKRYLLHILVLSGFIYLFTFQGGNVQHEYYQIILLPALAIGVGLGLEYALQNLKSALHPIYLDGILIVVLIFSVSFSYYNVKDYYNVPTGLVQIAKIISVLTKPTDKIVTDETGDTTLLYLSDRKGSPAPFIPLDDFKKEGYSYFVTTHSDVISQYKMQKKYTVVFENDQFALFKL